MQLTRTTRRTPSSVISELHRAARDALDPLLTHVPARTALMWIPSECKRCRSCSRTSSVAPFVLPFHHSIEAWCKSKLIGASASWEAMANMTATPHSIQDNVLKDKLYNWIDHGFSPTVSYPPHALCC